MAIKTFQGKIKRVFAKALPESDKYQNLFRHNLQLDDESWVGFGGGKREVFTIKEGKGYYDVKPGDTIFLKYEDDGKYKNAKKGDLTVIEKAPEASQNEQKKGNTQNKNQAQPQQQPQKPYKKDNSGVEAGNARTSAFNFFKGKLPDAKTIEETIIFFAEYGKKTKEEYAKKFPDLTEYEVGVSVGQALTTAASFVKTLDEVDNFVQNYLNYTVPFSLKVVKGEISQTVETKVEDKKEETKKIEDEVNSNLDWDDDIPF